MHASQIYHAALLLIAASVDASEPCISFRDARDRSAIDFAPLNGFVDVCSRDFQLCVALTQGYPPSVKTIGYFVPVEEWERYQKGDRSGFSRYLIAQRATTMSQAEFVAFKHYIHAQQGSMPDHTNLPATLDSQERVSLGIVDEADDSISFGTVLKLAPKDSGVAAPFLLGSVNVALQLKGETLCLYAFDTLKAPSDSDSVKLLAKRWLDCIRARNPN